MAQTIGYILAPAVGVTLSPFPIVAVILMLFSARAAVNGPAFVAGWVAGLAVVVVPVLFFVGSGRIERAEDGSSTVAVVIQLVLGIGLVLLGLKNWTARPRAGMVPTVPRWLATIDKTTPLVALGLGVLCSGLNPKNLIFSHAAGTAIAGAGVSLRGEIVMTILYILLASVSVAGPVIWYRVSPVSASANLEVIRLWLIHHHAIILAVVLTLLGALQMGQAVSGLRG